jgi:hypothetical protein
MFGGDVAGENADPMAPYREMLKAPLKVELSFIKRACKLNDEQRKQVIGAGREWLETYLPKFAKTQQDPNGQMVMVNVGPGNFAQQRRSKKNKQELPELIGAAIGDKLTDEQKKLYQDECEKREAFRRQAIVENIVAIVDDRLRLDAAQREAIAKSLVEHWGEFTPPPLEMFANMSSFNEYMPQLPANCITPHLNENQMREWRRSQSVTMSFGFGVSFDTNVIEDIDLNEGLEAEKK